MILVPEKLEMGPSGMTPSLARQDNKPTNQPFAENWENILSQNQQQSAPYAPSPSRGQVLTFPIFESSQRGFVSKMVHCQ